MIMASTPRILLIVWGMNVCPPNPGSRSSYTPGRYLQGISAVVNRRMGVQCHACFHTQAFDLLGYSGEDDGTLSTCTVRISAPAF